MITLLLCKNFTGGKFLFQQKRRWLRAFYNYFCNNSQMFFFFFKCRAVCVTIFLWTLIKETSSHVSMGMTIRYDHELRYVRKYYIGFPGSVAHGLLQNYFTDKRKCKSMDG